MLKKTQRSTVYRIHISFIWIFLSICFTVSGQNSTYEIVKSHFASCDSLLDDIAEKSKNINTLSSIDKFLLSKIKEYPGFNYIIRTNSKGKIISTVINQTVAPRKFRYIGNQNWYKIMEKTKEPYFGSIKNRKGYFLFWSYPILVGEKARFGGTIAAKIHLKRSFELIGQTKDLTFTSLYQGNVIFSNLQQHDDQQFIEKKLPLNGIDAITIKWYDETSKISAFQVAGSEKSLSSSHDREQSSGAKTQYSTGFESQVDEKPITLMLFIPIAVVCLLIIVGCIFILLKIAQRRRILLETIDKGRV